MRRNHKRSGSISSNETILEIVNIKNECSNNKNLRHEKSSASLQEFGPRNIICYVAEKSSNLRTRKKKHVCFDERKNEIHEPVVAELSKRDIDMLWYSETKCEKMGLYYSVQGPCSFHVTNLLASSYLTCIDAEQDADPELYWEETEQLCLNIYNGYREDVDDSDECFFGLEYQMLESVGWIKHEKEHRRAMTQTMLQHVNQSLQETRQEKENSSHDFVSASHADFLREYLSTNMQKISRTSTILAFLIGKIQEQEVLQELGKMSSLAAHEPYEVYLRGMDEGDSTAVEENEPADLRIQ